MARDVRRITIDSILGGESALTHFSGEGQFLFSAGINPALGIEDASNNHYFAERSSGLIRPSPSTLVALDTEVPTNSGGFPMWFVPSPRETEVFIYQSTGSIYSYNGVPSNFGYKFDITDAADKAEGNGAAYYDNYLYFASNTTISRYGPLKGGSAALTQDYWSTTLGQPELEDVKLPVFYSGTPTIYYPNHILHRHSNGRLYIADVVGEQGTLHYIETGKTTIEGDTDKGSTYDALNLGFGVYISAMESYGENLVLALVEGHDSTGDRYTMAGRGVKAKVAFWDTTSTDINSITWVEFPDAFISAIYNLNGTLYFFSGSGDNEDGWRLTRYVGGNVFENVWQSPLGEPPPHGAVDGIANHLVFGARVKDPHQNTYLSVMSFGLNMPGINSGLFNIMICDSQTNNNNITALHIDGSESPTRQVPIAGHIDGITEGSRGLDYGQHENVWYSEMFRIGQPYKILSVRIPLAEKLATNSLMYASFCIDGYDVNSESANFAISPTDYGTNSQSIVIRPIDIKGDHEFCLKLLWTGTARLTVSLPIVIEYELLDIDHHKK